jgi:hypothetical protein
MKPEHFFVKTLALAVYLFFFSSCFLSEDQEILNSPLTEDQEIVNVHLTNDIFFSRHGSKQNQFILRNLKMTENKLIMGDVLINRSVYAVGYNGNFIIAKQLVLEESTKAKSNITKYHIIEARGENRIFTFNNEDDFSFKRTVLGVPDTLSFFLTSIGVDR